MVSYLPICTLNNARAASSQVYAVSRDNAVSTLSKKEDEMDEDESEGTNSSEPSNIGARNDNANTRRAIQKRNYFN